MLWKSESTSTVEAVKPKSVHEHVQCSAHAAGKIEITRKKKRVDSCGMLEKSRYGVWARSRSPNKMPMVEYDTNIFAKAVNEPYNCLTG